MILLHTHFNGVSSQLEVDILVEGSSVSIKSLKEIRWPIDNKVYTFMIYTYFSLLSTAKGAIFANAVLIESLK